MEIGENLVTWLITANTKNIQSAEEIKRLTNEADQAYWYAWRDKYDE